MTIRFFPTYFRQSEGFLLDVFQTVWKISDLFQTLLPFIGGEREPSSARLLVRPPPLPVVTKAPTAIQQPFNFQLDPTGACVRPAWPIPPSMPEWNDGCQVPGSGGSLGRVLNILFDSCHGRQKIWHHVLSTVGRESHNSLCIHWSTTTRPQRSQPTNI